MEEWVPKTELGRQVRARQITDINEILDNGHTILEAQITDTLLPEMQSDLLLIGQSKGKFGGGRRRVFRQTQKKTREGNKPRFAAYAVVGNGDGIVGLGYGKARETVPAREKAQRKAKLNVFKIARGAGSWESPVREPHTIPFTVEGKCGSVVVRLIPAPKGKGLIAEKEIQKILQAAGVEDVWSQTFGQTKNKINLIKATEQALRKLSTTRLQERDVSNLAIAYGNTEPIAIAAPEPAKEEAAAAKSTVKPAEKKAEKPTPRTASAPEQKTKPTTQESSVALTDVSGISDATQETLVAAGIDSVEKLANASVEALTELDGVGKATAEKFIAGAKELIK